MRVTLAVAVSLLFVCSLVGQTTASLIGKVTSGNAAVAGATVTVDSPALQGTRSTTTSANGTYAIDALPPGNYSVTITMRGMRPVTKQTRLQLSGTTAVDASLAADGVSESITVTADVPPAVAAPPIANNLTLAEVEKLPVPRNQLATSQLPAGVTANVLANGELAVSGGPGYDDLAMINGVVVNENVRGQLRPLYVEDAIEETTVLTGAIPAEYGRFTGGVINSVTRSGGNELTATLRDSLSNPAWSAQTPAGEARENNLNQVWEATLGGFIVRDRLWFFGAGRSANNDTARQTVSIPPFTGPASSPASPALSYAEKNDQRRYEEKLTAQITPAHSLVASHFSIDTNTQNSRFGNAIYDTASFTEQHNPDRLLIGHYTGVFTPSLLVEAQASRRTFALQSGATTTDLLTGTVLLDRANGNTRFGAPSQCAVCGSDRRNNRDLLAKAHWLVRGHDLAAGVDRFDEMRTPNNHQSGSDFLVFVTRVQWNNGVMYPVITPTSPNGGNTFIRWSPIVVAARPDDLRTDSAFVQDAWSLGRWSVNAGLRYDRNHAVDADGTVASDDSRLSPRLAVQYDFRGDGRHRLIASYGHYVARIIDGIASSNEVAGNATSIDFAYRGPAINANALTVPLPQALQLLFNYFENQQGGTANTAASNLRPNGLRTVPGFATYFDGSLASPYVREATLGYAMQLGTSGFVRADLVDRDWRDFYAASVTPATRRATTPLGIPVDLVLERNSNNLRRQYRALQLQGRWTPRPYDAGLDYTLSSLRGNDDGEGANGPVANADPSIYYPELLNYARFSPIGPLQGDERHRLRAWLGRDFGPFTATVLQSFDSGQPYSAAGAIIVGRSAIYNSAPNGQYYFSDRGAFRTDDIASTDLALRYRRPLAGRLELFLDGDLLNAFNRKGIADPTKISTTVITAATSSAYQPFNPFTDKPVLGKNYALAPNFGQPLNDLAYQTPRTYRFSLGFRF